VNLTIIQFNRDQLLAAGWTFIKEDEATVTASHSIPTEFGDKRVLLVLEIRHDGKLATVLDDIDWNGEQGEWMRKVLNTMATPWEAVPMPSNAHKKVVDVYPFPVSKPDNAWKFPTSN
jgi:hypothetical protein